MIGYVHVRDSPTHEVKAVRTHKDVAIGVHLQQVSIGRVKHQTSERETLIVEGERKRV